MADAMEMIFGRGRPELDCGAKNTDREIWRGPDDGRGDFYADSLFITEAGSLGINCGGYVLVKPIREWFDVMMERYKVQFGKPR